MFDGGVRFAGWREVMSTRWRLNPGPAATYEAFDRARGEHVWIKSYPNSLGVVEYEYETLLRLRDSGPHVLRVHELFVGPSYVAFSAERLDGTTLRACFARPERDFARLRGLLARLVRALDAVHRSGFVHRDVRPETVLVTSERRMVLAGFAPEEQPQSIDSVFHEQFSSYEAADRGEACDFYSVGVILFEALTGWRPFERDREQFLKVAMGVRPTFEPSAIPQDVPEDLGRLCLALVAADPVERPAAPEILRVLGG